MQVLLWHTSPVKVHVHWLLVQIFYLHKLSPLVICVLSVIIEFWWQSKTASSILKSLLVVERIELVLLVMVPRNELLSISIKKRSTFLLILANRPTFFIHVKHRYICPMTLIFFFVTLELLLVILNLCLDILRSTRIAKLLLNLLLILPIHLVLQSLIIHHILALKVLGELLHIVVHLSWIVHGLALEL